MPDISEAFSLARVGDAAGASEMLRYEFEKLQSPARRIDLCEWIADCFEKLEDYVQAGSWYETAGELMLVQVGSTLASAAVNAYRLYERALGCYEKGGELEEATRCYRLLSLLRSSFSAS